MSDPTRTLFLEAVSRERDSQDKKWGLSAGRPVPPLRILVEEVGEVARAMNDHCPTEMLVEELIQVAAVACAMVEGIDRGDVPR